jgi:hypothetical protein
VATPLVALHVAAHTKRLAAAVDGALERLLSRVRVVVDAKRAGSGKGLVARHADVAVLALLKGRSRGHVVAVPRVWRLDHGWEVGRQGALIVDASAV